MVWPEAGLGDSSVVFGKPVQANPWHSRMKLITHLDYASQLRHASAPVDTSIHQLLSLHIISNLPFEVHPTLAVPCASKVLGAAGYESDCECAAKEGQGPLLPEAMDERNDPATALQSLT